MAKPISIDLDKPHPGQRIVSAERERFNVLSCGRRWGKTDFTYQLIAEIIKYNLNGGHSEDMGYMSPTYKNLAPTWRKFTRVFKDLITRKNEQEHVAEILNSFVIEFWSLDKPENIRGRKYKRIIVDEAALIIGLKQICKLILFPTIGDLIGDCWLFSTPRGFNDFHHYYELGQNPLFVNWNSWQMPTSSNPYFPKAELEEQRALLDPDEFAQEWEGKFVSLGNNPFDIDGFTEYNTMGEAIFDQVPLYKIRYWDIANSADGDYTASTKMTITDRPQFVISDPVRYKGTWGTNYPYIKSQMLIESDVLHVIETEGVGGIAWQMIQMDAELKHINKMPAGKMFTNQSKVERANLWALELRNGRMGYVKGFGMTDVMEEIKSFPAGDHDDYVDGISGNVLAFIYFFGGYAKLIDAKKIHKQDVGGTPSYRKETIIELLSDEFTN